MGAVRPARARRREAVGLRYRWRRNPRLHPRWHRGSSRNYQGSDRSRRLISRRVYRGAQRMLTHPAAPVTIGPRPARPRRFRIAQHHHGVARGRHQVVALLVHLPILAMIKPEFFEPLIQVPQHLEAPALHPNEHVRNAGLDRHRSVLELCVLEEHLKALRTILIRKRLAGALQRLAATIPWPRPRQFLAPQFECCRVNDGGGFSDAVAFAYVNGICVSVPNQFDRRERMVPTKIHSTDAWPVAGEIALLGGEQFFGDGKDAART